MSETIEEKAVDVDQLTVSQCTVCVHKFDGEPGCEAFPDGIPMPILLNQHHHSEPYPGDNGIRFEFDIEEGAFIGIIRPME